MSRLDLKERLLISYVLKYIILPGVGIVGILQKLQIYLKDGGFHTALFALLGSEFFFLLLFQLVLPCKFVLCYNALSVFDHFWFLLSHNKF